MSNNSIVVQGKVMATPEVKTSAKGIKYTRVPIMTESSYNDKTTRQNITIVFFGDIADKTAVLKEGDFAEIKGRAINEKNSENKLTLGIVGYEMSKVAEGYKNTSVLSGFINNKNLEIKQGEKGTKYITVALAVKREGEEKVYDTYFVNAFGKSAERIAQTYSQGDLIELTGSIQGDNGKLSLIAHRSKLLREVIKENQNKNQQVKTSEDINDNN